MEKHIDITNRFRYEIREIAYILDGLKSGRIYGYKGNYAKNNGSLETNAEKLEKAFMNLVCKIQYGEDSDFERISKMFDLHKKDKW